LEEPTLKESFPRELTIRLKKGCSAKPKKVKGYRILKAELTSDFSKLRCAAVLGSKRNGSDAAHEPEKEDGGCGGEEAEE
jgi:hypothetical protein